MPNMSVEDILLLGAHNVYVSVRLEYQLNDYIKLRKQKPILTG